jgi:energy-coupling factor transport system permease protein
MTVLALRHARGTTPIHALNPLTKLLLVTVFWLVSLGSFNPVVLIALTVVALVLWRIANIPLGYFLRLLLLLSIVFTVLTIINGFMYYNGKTPLLPIVILGRPFTVEGVLFGITISLKILAVVTFIPVLTFTTPMPRLMAAMARLRLPYKFVFTFGVAMRFTPLVGQTFRDIIAAQRLRGYDVEAMPFLTRVFRGYVPVFIPLVLTLLRRASDLDVAIESRGFGAPVERTYLDELSFGPLDVVVIAFALLVFAAVLLFGSAIPQVYDINHV